MRVAVVVRSLKIGGMERSAINIAQSFADNGDESHLIYFKTKNAGLKPEKNVFTHHFDLDTIAKLTIIGFFWNILARIFNSVIRGSYFFWNGMLSSLIFKYKIKQLEKEYGKFDLIILRGQGTFENVWMLKDDRIKQVSVSMFIFTGGKIKNFFLKKLYHDKNIICISNGIKNKIEEVSHTVGFQPRSIHVIYNPMNIELVQKKALEYTPEIQQKYIVYFGRITPNKNVDLLIEAYKFAQDNFGFNMKLVIIGDGPEYKNIQNKIEDYNLSNTITMLGALSNPYPWVQNAELFVFTSKAEGLGNVLLESLACHTPIVSVKTIGGPEDIMVEELEDFRVDFTKEALVNKIIQTLNEKPTINFDKFLLKFQPNHIAKIYHQIYAQ